MTPPRSVRTHGLTHIALTVQDVEQARRFYESAFGMVAVHADAGFVQMQTPGTRDVLVLEKASPGKRTSPEADGVKHFGFRLVDPGDIDAAAAAIERAGGMITERGEFVPSEPYIYFKDLDGYQVEVWYELPTPVDPK